METLEELKAIIAGKPEGASHYDGKSYFTFVSEVDDGINYFNWRKWVNNKRSIVVCQSRLISNLRSLSDIERIIELMECLKSIEQTVEGGDVLGCWDMMKIKDCFK